MGSAQFCRKSNGLLHSECRKVDVVLSTENDISPITIVNVTRRQRVEVDISVDTVVFLMTVGECLEERRTSRTWATKYHCNKRK